MVNPIKCPGCGAIVIADEKTLDLSKVTKNIKCPQCDHLVVRARRILTQAQSRRRRKKNE